MALQTLDDFVPAEPELRVPRRPLPPPRSKRATADLNPTRLRESTIAKVREYVEARQQVRITRAKADLSEIPPARVELAISKLADRGVVSFDGREVALVVPAGPNGATADAAA